MVWRGEIQTRAVYWSGRARATAAFQVACNEQASVGLDAIRRRMYN
ncbi:hypothetical protein EIKCOROL_00528 [Eikenella corrodens ATCC 23834]|uniref:Uncharacterized protein n=1 Tax=Eikenella corrodens ATCC 23834 TaxID=546274 RepID=C0DT50_EIKCO|nr:hypothetical protein EIKCOROL_00528 [Eikenella corrodens ATCC 23834]